MMVGRCRYRPGDRNNRKIFPVVTLTRNFGIGGTDGRLLKREETGKSISGRVGFSVQAREGTRSSSGEARCDQRSLDELAAD